MNPELSFKVFGEGEPVVILHGLFGMRDNWQTFAKALAEHYMVYIIDQRDHGRSPHTEEFNYKLLADDLNHFLESQWIYEARFIGHSMGGKTLLQFVKDYYDKIDQMIVVDIAPKSYVGGHETIIKALNSVDVEKIQSRSEAEEQLSNQIKDISIIQFLLKNLSRRKQGGYQWKMNLDLLTKSYPQILSGIEYTHEVDVDTLFVRGGQSNYIEDDDFETIKQHFLNSRMETIDGAGHWVHASHPEELLKLTLDYFKKG